jgi:hypothetical protein
MDQRLLHTGGKRNITNICQESKAGSLRGLVTLLTELPRLPFLFLCTYSSCDISRRFFKSLGALVTVMVEIVFSMALSPQANYTD